MNVNIFPILNLGIHGRRPCFDNCFPPQITGLTKSCACGHVLEDATRCIGGKRYSGI